MTLEMFVNNEKEQSLLFSSLNPNTYFLEFGSGMSTVAISKRVRKIVSIEHSEEYYNQTKELLAKHDITNCELILVLPNEEAINGDDDTEIQFKDYVNAPSRFVENEKFDVCFVDGRARVACAKYAAEYCLKPNGTIFIHDYGHPQPEYRRYEHEAVEEFLNRVDGHFAMHKFKIKHGYGK